MIVADASVTVLAVLAVSTTLYTLVPEVLNVSRVIAGCGEHVCG